MSNILTQLQGLLAKASVGREIGTVTKVSGNTVIVQVGAVNRRVANNTATLLKAGDLVSLQGDVLLGRAGLGSRAREYKL